MTDLKRDSFSASKRKRIDWRLIRRFFATFRPYWKYAYWGAAGVLFASLLQIPGPFLTEYLVDSVLPQKSKNLVLIVSAGILFLLVLKSVTNIINKYVMTKYREDMMMKLRLGLFEHTLNQPVSFFKANDTGYLLSRISNDVYQTQGVFADSLLSALSSLLTFMFGVAALFYIHWKMALVSLAVLPVYLLVGDAFGLKVRIHSRKIQENAAQIGELIGESLLGAFAIKIFSSEPDVHRRAVKLFEKAKKDNIWMAVLNSLNGSASGLVGGIGSLIVLGYGIIEIMGGSLTIGKLMAFNGFLAYLYSPLGNFSGLYGNVQNSISAIERIFEIMSLPNEFAGDDGENQKSRIQIQGRVRFENVSFSYSEGNNIIKNMSFEILPGENVAIVGKTGAGKSTLISMIPRLYEPTSGDIFIDDLPLTEIPKRTLRKQIGYVSQDTFLFKGSILENVRLGRSDVTKEAVESIIEPSGLGSLMRSLSINLDTEVGVLGSKLSGGQKQLISIARVMVIDPPLIILDEATAHMDYETEEALKRAIDVLISGRTTITIAHRLYTIQKADKILMLDDGNLIAIGTHGQLYESVPYYRRFFEEKFKVEEPMAKLV
ncbi:MAG: ABC transporter ATP-binding protein [Acidobacteria bacterium]|nr:ABC transporter ATP-binding protein [Acidobacteriota bacterium]